MSFTVYDKTMSFTVYDKTMSFAVYDKKKWHFADVRV